MKRSISLVLVLVLALSLAACGQSNGKTETQTPPPAAPQEISWDTSGIYPNTEAFEAELSKVEDGIADLAALRGKLNTVEGVVAYYDTLDQVNNYYLGRLSAYTTLLIQKDQSDSKAKELEGKVNNLAQKLGTETAFALPELFANSESFLDKLAAEPRMEPYRLWFSRDRAARAHTLPEEQEQLLQPLYQMRDGAASLYNSLIYSDMQFPTVKFPDGTEGKADENSYPVAWDPTYSQEFRLEYYNKMMGAYGQYRNTLAQNMQNFYTAVTQSAAAHGYASALEADLAPVQTPLAVYDSILDAAAQAEPSLERYYERLKKTLGVETLYGFETNALAVVDPGTTYPYEDAKILVKAALAPLGEAYAKKLDVMLTKDAIDVYPAENKYGGAFTTDVPGAHPYILCNYTEDYHSVSTLAHELGHAVYMMEAGAQETYYGKNPGELTHEVTSALNQLLLSDYMIKNAKTDEERAYFAAQQLADLNSTFFTQVLFADFQKKLVEEIENGGTLTPDKLDELWLLATKENFGEDYTATETYQNGWIRVPHFYQGFYVYQYAVGMAAACNIADRIQAGDPDAVKDYLAFLQAGDSGNPVELLKIAGVDSSNGSYVSAFTQRFDRLLTELETVK